MSRLILASASLGRKKLLDYLNLKYEIIPSGLNEDKIIGKSPLETIELRARLKGEAVAASFKSPPAGEAGPGLSKLILSADSDAILDDTVIGKAVNRKEGIKILAKLSGRTHLFVTAVYIIKIDINYSNNKEAKPRTVPQSGTGTGVIYSGSTKSLVTFRKISAEEIDFYLDKTDFTRFAGSYALISAQDFITKVEGSLSNVIGLPLEAVIPVFQKVSLIK